MPIVLTCIKSFLIKLYSVLRNAGSYSNEFGDRSHLEKKLVFIELKFKT